MIVTRRLAAVPAALAVVQAPRVAVVAAAAAQTMNQRPRLLLRLQRPSRKLTGDGNVKYINAQKSWDGGGG